MDGGHRSRLIRTKMATGPDARPDVEDVRQALELGRGARQRPVTIRTMRKSFDPCPSIPLAICLGQVSEHDGSYSPRCTKRSVRGMDMAETPRASILQKNIMLAGAESASSTRKRHARNAGTLLVCSKTEPKTHLRRMMSTSWRNNSHVLYSSGSSCKA